MTKINGGATIWARQTVDSDIFHNKPDKWFKIWFYLINKVNHKKNKQFARGSNFMKYEWIMDKTKATKNEVDGCIRFLKKSTMITTQKTTGGFIVKVLNYNTFQNLSNYENRQQNRHRSDTGQKQVRNKTDTINKNDKNDKNGKNKKRKNRKKKNTLLDRCALVIDYLNEKTGRNEEGKRKFDPKNDSTVRFLRGRFNEGRTVKDCIDVIDKKVKDWLNDEKMYKFLRPSTLFDPAKFENYINELEPDKYAKYYKKE